MICGHKAASGLFANLEKSEALHLSGGSISSESRTLAIPTYMRVAKLAMADIMPSIMLFCGDASQFGRKTIVLPVTHAHPKSLPDAVPPCLTMGPMPCALTMIQMKYAIPAIGATIDLTVNRCLTFSTGNQTAGMWRRMKRKNDTKSLVVVPLDAGMLLGRLL